MIISQEFAVRSKIFFFSPWFIQTEYISKGLVLCAFKRNIAPVCIPADALGFAVDESIITHGKYTIIVVIKNTSQ